MAKKAQAIQLQTEINNDEEWEKLLLREGLIVVDVYSEWCGPCSGMTATLKKLKLEIGGDVLQLAIAKCDKITALERFRNKSEPTWMFIVNGKMVNFMFGANAPKLSRLITEELRKENDARMGLRDRTIYEIGDLADEERERLEIVENLALKARQKEEAKAAKELYERRTAECLNILENLNHLGVILIFPHARTSYQEAFGDLLGEAGLTIQHTEKVDLTLSLLKDLFYFTDGIPFSEDSIDELSNNTSVLLQIKPIARDLEEETDLLILRIVYGSTGKPPGDPDSVAQILVKLLVGSEQEVQPEKRPEIAIWAPEHAMVKATALKLFFHRITEHYLIAEPEPTPPHYAVIFDAIKRYEVAVVMEKYSTEVMRYGFFTSEIPEETKVVAKSIKKYERSPDRTPDEKLVIQLCKKKSECVLAFAQLKPLYISPNVAEGKRECHLFFPDDYDEPPEEENPEEESQKQEEEQEAKEPSETVIEEKMHEEGDIAETEKGQVKPEEIDQEQEISPEDKLQPIVEGDTTTNEQFSITPLEEIVHPESKTEAEPVADETTPEGEVVEATADEVAAAAQEMLE